LWLCRLLFSRGLPQPPPSWRPVASSHCGCGRLGLWGLLRVANQLVRLPPPACLHRRWGRPASPSGLVGAGPYSVVSLGWHWPLLLMRATSPTDVDDRVGCRRRSYRYRPSAPSPFPLHYRPLTLSSPPSLHLRLPIPPPPLVTGPPSSSPPCHH
jgi:hypothetical protein